MSQYPFIILLCIIIIISGQCQIIFDKTQYIIVYITSQSNISPILFQNSFNIFTESFSSVLHESLPTISTSFNITKMEIWCVQNDTIIPSSQIEQFNDIYASFYLNIDYVSDKDDIIISSITNRIDNDLLSLLINDKIQNINDESLLSTFAFETFDVISSKNVSFLSNNQIDCISYLIDIRQKRISSTTTTNIENNNNDNILTIDKDMFIGYTVLCILIGIIICTCIVCCHIRYQEHQRIKRKQKLKEEKRRKRKQRKRGRSYTPSCITSNTTIPSTIIEGDDIDGIDDNDTITIVRPLSAKTDITDIDFSQSSNIRRNVQINRRSSVQSELIPQSYNSNNDRSYLMKRKHSRKRNKSAISTISTISNASSFGSKMKKGYDQIGQYDEEDIELKQEELYDDDNNDDNDEKEKQVDNHNIISSKITRRMTSDNKSTDNSRRGSLETAVTHNTSTTNTEQKVVTVHVHHHYNPIIPNHIDNNHNMDNDDIEYYPELPSEIKNINVGYLEIPSKDDINLNNDIDKILSINNNKPEQKEPSKSQREGFSPNTKPRSRQNSKSKSKQLKNRIEHIHRKSIASQPDDHHSDSSGMYEPGPAAADDDTPGINNLQSPKEQDDD